MSGFRVAVKNVRLKKDPSGRVHLVRVHKLDAAKRKRIHAQAKREAAKWIEAAEHYTPIPWDAVPLAHKVGGKPLVRWRESIYEHGYEQPDGTIKWEQVPEQFP